MLRRAEESVPLPVHLYCELRRLPGWMFYGPEHGMPAEWLDTQGLLLERLRPGGADHEIFDRWRREYRRHRWIAFRLRERWRSRWRRHRPWAEPVLWGAAILIGFQIFERLTRDYGQIEKFGWVIGSFFAAAMIVKAATFVSGWLGTEASLLSWCAASKLRRWERCRGTMGRMGGRAARGGTSNEAIVRWSRLLQCGGCVPGSEGWA